MHQKDPIYLDNNATTRLDDAVVDAIIPYYTHFYANPGSAHLAGLTVKEAIEEAAWKTARLIGAKEEEILFTSGATEAINLVLKGLINEDKKHIVTVATEHAAVLDTCRFMESIGYQVSYFPVQSDGKLDLNLLDETITHKTLIVIVMQSNNETGVIHDIKTISKIVHDKNSLLLCDATQSAGKMEIDVKQLKIDYLALSAHKFHGPKGIGALYICKSAKTQLAAQIHGGGQQRKLRSGTLNVPGIIGLGKACEIADTEMITNQNKIIRLRNMLENGLLQIKDSYINGDKGNRMYNTTNICFPGINSEKIIIALRNISVSNGASCSAATSEPSHVLKAMGISNENALSSIRFSLSKYNTENEIWETIERMKELAEMFS